MKSQLTASGRLSPDVRTAIRREAHSRVSEYKSAFDQATDQYKGIVQRYRMNPDDVVPKFAPFEEYKPKAAVAPPAQEQTATNPQTGEKIIYRNGRWQPLGPRT